MKQWTRLLPLCTLLAAIMVQQSFAQMCGATIQVSSFSENLLEDDVRTCIECILGGSVATTATWLIGTVPLGAATIPIGESDGEVVNGVLVIFDPSSIIPGPGAANQIRVSCSVSGVGSLSFFISLAEFLPPEVMDVTVNETDNLLLVCVDNNVGGGTSAHWENSDGEVLVQNQQFMVMNVLRSYSGVYTCVLSRNDNNDTLSANATVTVQYAPELTSNEGRNQFPPLNQTLVLSCNFDGVPTPDIVWLHNDTELSSTAPGVTIMTMNETGTTTLTRDTLPRDGQGQYECRGTNVVGRDSIMINITVMVPPAPATNLRVTNVDEFEISLAWMNGVDGFSPITGVQIVIFEGNQLVDTVDRSGDSSLQATTIDQLDAFTDFRFELRVRNVIGLSDPVSVEGSTLSLMLSAPIIDSFTPVNSTVLELEWTAPASVESTEDASSWIVEYREQGPSSTPVVLTVFPTSVMIGPLKKGTSYTATVTGVNVRGPGDTSVPVTNQTIVDPPSPPQDLTVEGIAAMALDISWMPPTDNGGRPIIRYELSISEDNTNFTSLSTNIGSGDRMYRYRNSEVNDPFQLEENTTYWVRLIAVNSELLFGEDATVQGTTQSILQPQRIFETPEAPDNTISNITSVITWSFPGGNVSNYIIEYVLSTSTFDDRDDVVTVSVSGDRLMTTIDSLEPASAYDVRILVNNSVGMSVFSPVLSFNTANPPPPVVISNTNMTVNVGVNVQLTCVTDVRPARIQWLKDDENLPNFSRQQIIVLEEVALMNTGEYQCSVPGDPNRIPSDSFSLEVIQPTSPPDDQQGISTAVIIIVSVVGGLALIIFLAVVLFAVFCLCCWKKRSKGEYPTKKRKRSFTWTETSAKYVRNKNGASEETTGTTTITQKLSTTNQTSFDIPEDFTAHSSFNTLEKQNRIRQSSTPEDGVQISSFQTPQSNSQRGDVGPDYEIGSPNFEFVPPPETNTVV